MLHGFNLYNDQILQELGLTPYINRETTQLVTILRENANLYLQIRTTLKPYYCTFIISSTFCFVVVSAEYVQNMLLRAIH